MDKFFHFFVYGGDGGCHGFSRYVGLKNVNFSDFRTCVHYFHR